MDLRDYQWGILGQIYGQWSIGHKHVMAVLSTGGGKTKCIAQIVLQVDGVSVTVAHRLELIYQLSMALAALGIYHRIIAPDPVIRFIVRRQIKYIGRSYINDNALAAVGSVDTIKSRMQYVKPFLERATLIQGDEGHHWLADNKWGEVYNQCIKAKGVLWTATPRRTDRKSLRAGYGGLATALVKGPPTRWLIGQGYLSNLTVYGPPLSYSRDNLTVGGTGDFSTPSVQRESRKSQIVGDIIQHWQRLAPGKRTLVFLTDVTQGFETAERFRQIGAPAVAMSAADTSTDDRVANMEKFERDDIKIVVNVDLFGEGTDVPGVEAISDGAATMSDGRLIQRRGRAMRIAPGKTSGIYIDHVGNHVDFLARRGCWPEDVDDWSLDVPERRPRTPNDEAAIKACLACLMLFEQYKSKCPYCGHTPERAPRSLPEEVAGDLMEYTPEVLKALTAKANHIVGAAPPGTPAYIRGNWDNRAAAQVELRRVMGHWGGRQVDELGVDIRDAWRLFYARFGVDVKVAQTWGAPDAVRLTAEIMEDMT